METVCCALGPGLLLAATGVGAGDLLTASLGGSNIGLAILWAAWVGGVLKWFLNEGIARWQMSTGTTLLEGWVHRLGGWIQWVFLVYLLIWSFFTGGALISACGVAGTGLWPLSADLQTSKILWGVIHSLVALVLVWIGSFHVFERVMSVCIAVMFVSVIASAACSAPDWSALMAGMLVPAIPPGSSAWVLGILGGVGGTVTMLSYGYWIREKGRRGAEGLRACRTDLTVGYAMTALFGMAMVVIGSSVDLRRGPAMALDLAGQLGGVLGAWGEWVFLAGFWAAVFSSMLGVWQSVPYLFADFVWTTRRQGTPGRGAVVLARTPAYRIYLVAIALLPMPLLWVPVAKAQLAYAVMGALFMPLLAVTLLIMNNKAAWVGPRHRSGWVANAALVAALLLFVFIGAREGRDKFSTLFKTPSAGPVQPPQQ